MSNGKKLGVKSKVSDNYLVTGNDYEKFQEALHDMDNRTVIIPGTKSRKHEDSLCDCKIRQRACISKICGIGPYGNERLYSAE